jgi:uncharacterized membrane protein
MRKRLESVTAIGRKIGINDEKGYGVAVFLALIVVAVVVGGFFVSSWLNPKPEGYSTIYLLDTNQKAADYTEVLVSNRNSTFNVWVAVENHNDTAQSYQVQVKITKNLSSYPLNNTQATQVFETGDVSGNGGSWRNMATITENEKGSYAVVFELYQHSSTGLQFTYNYCVLNIKVI